MIIYRRCKEFGCITLMRTYWRMGVLPTAIWEFCKYLVGRNTTSCMYINIMRRVVPVLEQQYRPLLQQLKEKYRHSNAYRQHSRKIWFCWLQGLDNAPEIVRVCLRSQQKVFGDREVVVIDYHNYTDYVTLPDYFVRKYEQGRIPNAHFTDLLRLELLSRYGGTWMDATVLCTSANYPPRVMDCDLFLFQYPHQEGHFGTVSSWFITSCANNPVVLTARDLFRQYYRDYDCTTDYYIIHQFFAWAFHLFPKEYLAMPWGSSLAAIELGRRMKRGEAYNAQWMQRKLDHSCFHKLPLRIPKSIMKKPDGYYSHILTLA
ncbi:MAG: hypothetical protein J6Y39_05660 [Bacteroidaceae bacterium]|nr:hypothetical protein [Bacteroidaceae bacterium]